MLDISVLERKNFKPKEFIYSVTAETEGIDNNIYDIETLVNASRTMDLAQDIRNYLDYPIIITSGYRCLKLNRAIGSRDISQHIKGQAIDFICPKYGNPEQIVKALRNSNITVDQCLVENDIYGNEWVHVSKKESGKNRNEFAYFLLNKEGKREKIIMK